MKKTFYVIYARDTSDNLWFAGTKNWTRDIKQAIRFVSAEKAQHELRRGSEWELDARMKVGEVRENNYKYDIFL